jgi:nucleotide-binding universal stress UspA family protein
MALLCALPLPDLHALPAAARPLADALGLPLLGTAAFDPAASADPARPAELVAAIRSASADLEAMLPAGVQPAGLALRLNGEPEWAPPVRRAIELDARLLAVDSREGPGLSSLGEIVRAAPMPVVAIGPRFEPGSPAPVRVLALTDGSPTAAAVGPGLTRLLAGSAVPVELLAVAVPALGEAPRERELELARALEELEAAMPGVQVVHRRVEPARSFESVAAAAIRVARESAATHIALSTHGRGLALRFLLGSVADALVRSSPLPLLLVVPLAERSGG